MIIALALIVLALLGAPLFTIIASGAMLGFRAEDVDLQVIAIEIYRLAEMPILLASSARQSALSPKSSWEVLARLK